MDVQEIKLDCRVENGNTIVYDTNSGVGIGWHEKPAQAWANAAVVLARRLSDIRLSASL